MKNKIDWKLYLVTDVEYTGAGDLPAKTQAAVQSGVTLVQLRAKKTELRKFLQVANTLLEILDPLEIPLIINDRLDVALACDAAGVHLGQNDMPLAIARRILGEEKIIGVSVNNVPQAIAAQVGGADYVAASPVFYTASKKDLDPELGLAGIKELRAKIDLPIIAIGGINTKNAADVMAAGADGLAVISAILGADNISQATQEILKTIDY